MKWIGAVLLTLGMATSAVAAYYSVTVTRKDQDVYKVEFQTRPVFIFTRFCYEYVYFDEAVLRYEPYSYDNKIVFSDSSTCEVDKVVVGG